MKLSIIVPVYNMESEGKLAYCLDSLIGQTIQDYEIIAVDDASTDSSPTILREYEKKYPECFKAILCQENRRQGGAKNEGLQQAKGEWIGFIDSDDWVTPDFYERLISKGEETGADVVGCDYNLVTGHTMDVGKVVRNNSMEQTGEMTKEKKKNLLIRPGSMVIKVYRHSVIKENHLDFPESIFYEDNCAGTIWMYYCKRFEKIEDPLYYYYQHEASTVHYISEAKCQDRVRAGECLLKEAENRGLLKEFKDEIEYRFTEVYYSTTLFSYMQGMRRPKLQFTGKLRQEMKRVFPDFQRNPYYEKMMGEEEKKWIRIHMKGNWYFFLYYRLVFLVRKWKKGVYK